MKEKIIGIVVCILMACTVLPASSHMIVDVTHSSTMSGSTLHVGGIGPGNYTYIQDVINDSGWGDTVFVHNDSSPYLENLVVNKSINLLGEDKETTIVDGQDKGNVMFVTADMVSVSGFTITNSTDNPFPLTAGVHVYANSTTISNNVIKDNFFGISVSDYAASDHIHHEFYGNNVSNNFICSNENAGIWLANCKHSTVTNNIILDNNFSGIHANFAIHNVISGNKLSNNTNGITLFQDCDSNQISTNNITDNKYLGIYIIDSMVNKILKNNFIENGNKNAKFLYFIWSIKTNRFDGNYWDDKGPSPYFIRGKLSIFSFFGLIPWLEIDWKPASEPYDI
jgi:parallel beta-helix repeat protein